MKPIIVVYVSEATNQIEISEIHKSAPVDLKNEYHLLIIRSDKSDIKVYFEKDQVELDKEKLEHLLSLCK